MPPLGVSEDEECLVILPRPSPEPWNKKNTMWYDVLTIDTAGASGLGFKPLTF
jgi:hypothetical protein